MDRQTLITNLYVDPDIAKAIGKMNPAELRDDLRQEMFLALCEQPEEKLMRMYEEGWIKFFLVRTMLNMIKSDRSTFHKLFRANFSEFMDWHSKATTEVFEAKEDTLKCVTEALDGLAWYEREVLKLYAEKRNIVQISRETKIPYRSIFKTIQNARRKMKSALKKELGQQAKLIGNYVTATMEFTIDISNDMNPDELADLLTIISENIREKVCGHSVDDANINQITDLKIKQII